MLVGKLVRSIPHRRELRANNDEFAELRTVFDQAKGLTTLGRRPLFVLTADLGQKEGWFAAQNKLATLSANSVHETAHGATHAALLEDQQFASITRIIRWLASE